MARSVSSRWIARRMGCPGEGRGLVGLETAARLSVRMCRVVGVGWKQLRSTCNEYAQALKLSIVDTEALAQSLTF